MLERHILNTLTKRAVQEQERSLIGLALAMAFHHTISDLRYATSNVYQKVRGSSQTFVSKCPCLFLQSSKCGDVTVVQIKAMFFIVSRASIQQTEDMFHGRPAIHYTGSCHILYSHTVQELILNDIRILTRNSLQVCFLSSLPFFFVPSLPSLSSLCLPPQSGPSYPSKGSWEHFQLPRRRRATFALTFSATR